MTVKCAAVVAATVAATQCLTVNILVEALTRGQVPAVLNMFALAAVSVSTLVAVQAALYERTRDRLTAVADFLVTRLSEIDEHVTDHSAGFVEGYRRSHPAVKSN